MSQAGLFPISSPFMFQDKLIRTQLEDQTLWFVAMDVCAALGIMWKAGKGTGNSGTLSVIPSKWQEMRFFYTSGGRQKLRCITEPAVYKLAFRSNKPEADAFTNWIASEVVPSIRKTGKYETAPDLPTSDSLPADSITITRSTPTDRAPLRSLVNAWARVSGQPFEACWSQLKAAFRITDIRDMPQEWIGDAVAWVQEKIDALSQARALPPSASVRQALSAPRRAFIHPRLTAEDYALRAADLAALERDAWKLEQETRQAFLDIQRRYDALAGSAFSTLLGGIPVRRFANSDPIVDVLTGHFGQAYRGIDTAFNSVRYALRAAAAANSILAESV